MENAPEHSNLEQSDSEFVPLSLAAFEQLSEGVIIADSVGKLIFVNGRAAELHGVRQLDVEPDDYSDVYQLLTMDGEPHPSAQLPLARAVMNGEVVEDALWKIRRPDATEIIALGTAKPVFDDDNRQIASVLTISDHTDAFNRQKKLSDDLNLREAMLIEVNHRVKNNLQIVASLLNIEADRVDDANTKKSLDDLSRRMEVIADVNRRLYMSGLHREVDLVPHLRALIEGSLAKLAGYSNVHLTLKASGSATLPVDKTISLSLAMNELVLNSIRHAFETTAAPEIHISISVLPDLIEINYSDNGCGTTNKSEQSETGFGTMLLSGLQSQLDASMAEAAGSGFGLSITIPRKS